MRLGCLSSSATFTIQGHFSERSSSRCPYFEKFDRTRNEEMNGLLLDKTGFLNTFKEWKVGGATDFDTEWRYVSAEQGRQDSLEIEFEVEISSQNDGTGTRATMDSYTFDIDDSWNDFQPWDYFKVESRTYANPGNNCGRSHDIPRITLYQCAPINDNGGYGDRDTWSVFQLVGANWGTCLSVDSYGVSENLKAVPCQDEVPDTQKFVAFLSESGRSQLTICVAVRVQAHIIYFQTIHSLL